MPGTFHLKPFAELNLADPFFDSLKADYPGDGQIKAFSDWFEQKAKEGRTALVFQDENGIGAFISIKEESEQIVLTDKILPAQARCKITTIKIAERYRGQRLGEGAIGLVLWKWQHLGLNDIYVTAYDKHVLLISQLKKFGFQLIGHNSGGEGVYLRSKTTIDYSDPYRSFPFIKPDFTNSGYLIVEAKYHDTLFPYSELKNTLQSSLALSVKNGLSKIYVGAQFQLPPYQVGDPLLVYRKHPGPDGKRFKSCLTSWCVVTKIIQVKKNWKHLMNFDTLLGQIGNKSVFDEDELRKRYNEDRNVLIIEMLYCGYFGAGNNVNMNTLDSMGHWSNGHGGTYPTSITLTRDDFIQILEKGNVDVDNVIIDQATIR
ncbi:hypothetical protein [Schaalia odontolytica]